MGTTGSDHQTTARTGRFSRLALRTQPDDRLVQLVREGQECAYEEIVRRYRSALVRFAATIVPPHLAEDTVQDALIRAHAALVANDSELSLRAWLYTIVRNGAVSERRKIRPTEQLDETINGVPRPPDIVERKENVRGVVARLKVLPEQQREALVRTELGGESAQEVALALGTTTGAVGQLIFRARASLRAGAALVLPMPVLRMLLSAPSSGGAGATATGGLLASTLGGGGGSIAVKVGAAIVVAAIAVGPGPGSGGDGDQRDTVDLGGIGAGTPAVEEEPDGSHASGSHDPGSHESTGGADHSGSANPVGTGGGAPDTRGSGGSGGQNTGGSETQSFDGGQVSSETSDGSGGGGGGDGSEPAAPPPSDGGHHDGSADQPAGTAPPPPPPQDDGGSYGGSHDGGGTYPGGHDSGGHQAYNDPDDGYRYPSGGDGGGMYDGGHDGHP